MISFIDVSLSGKPSALYKPPENRLIYAPQGGNPVRSLIARGFISYRLYINIHFYVTLLFLNCQYFSSHFTLFLLHFCGSMDSGECKAVTAAWKETPVHEMHLGSDYQWDMVRLGAAMYGINTAPYRENQMKSVVEVKAPVLQIANLPKGDFVGYSATYRATEDRKLAIVSIGYGDGIPRSLSNVGKVFFNICGRINEARIIGRLSMDNIICDVTNVENLQVGDMAEILSDYYTLDDMGRDAGTISYEILSRIGKNTRYIRKYIGK